jgi:putative lipoic acid-binding regulatory protein
MQVNEYPGQRTFKAIGAGGDDFVVSMTGCVEAVVGSVHVECVNTRLSAGGKYVSVTVGPVWVETPDQVLEIYNRMRADDRLKYFL